MGWKAVEMARAKGALPGSPLFPAANNLKETTKSGMINAWKAHLGNEVSGHSARRSGAMYYVRAGLPIQELAFLGRWKSSVVLTYAEEALQEKAVEIPTSMVKPDREVAHELKEMDDQGPPVVAPNTPVFTAMPQEPPEEHAPSSLFQSLQPPRDLWVVTKGRGWKGRPRHRVTRASWNVAMSSWSTACGWNFAARSADFYFLPSKVTDKLKCAKCELLDKGATSQVEEGLRLEDAASKTAEIPAQAAGVPKRRKTNADTPTETK